MPVVPDNVQAEVRSSSAYYRSSHQCIFCSLIDEALTFEATLYDRETGEIRRKIDVGQFVIERSKRFVAIKPFASRYEWEMHILPLAHQADFLDSGPEDLTDLAKIFKGQWPASTQCLAESSIISSYIHCRMERNIRGTLRPSTGMSKSAAHKYSYRV